MLRISGCCCCDLKTGGLVLGWLGLIGSILNIINGFYRIQTMNVNSNKDPNTSPELAIMASLIVNSIIEIFINIGLLWGIRKEKRFFLLPWLIMRMISLVVYYLVVIGGSIALFIFSEIIYGIIALICGLCLCVFLTYCWICVQNLYVQFQEGERGGPRSQQEEIGFIEHRQPIPTVVGGNLPYPPPPYKNI